MSAADRIRGLSSDRVFSGGGGDGAAAAEDLAATLAAGNTSGPNDVVMEAGQKIDLGGTPGDPDGSLVPEPSAALGRGVKAQDSGADEGCLLYTGRSMYAFATGTNQGERSGMALDPSEAQLEFYYNNSRAAYMTANGTNFQTRRIDNFRLNNTNNASDTTILPQDTGSIQTNIGAAGLVTLTLPSAPSEGMNFTVFRVADFALRVQPFPAETNAIILSSGKLPDDNYVELGTVGSSIRLVANTQGDWMAVNESGTVTPE